MSHEIRSPKISIILPVYNGDLFLKEAIHSILTQSLEDFELIVVNDGSTDTTLEIIKTFSTDPRIKFISRENRGLVASLNEGIELSSGSYIARQDADDISEPDRFKKQFELLQSNPSTVIVGSSIKTLDMKGSIKNKHFVIQNNNALKAELLVRSPFAHGSVMIRKSALVKAGGYQQADWPAEDYGLWVRMASLGKFANLKETLYQYRENEQGISLSNIEIQNERAETSRLKAWTNPSNYLKLFKVIKTEHSNNIDARIFDNFAYILKRARQENNYSIVFCVLSNILISPMLLKRSLAKIIRR